MSCATSAIATPSSTILLIRAEHLARKAKSRNVLPSILDRGGTITSAAGPNVTYSSVVDDMGTPFDWGDDIITLDGTATVGDSDYQPVVAGAGTIAAGQTQTNVTIVVNGDNSDFAGTHGITS